MDLEKILRKYLLLFLVKWLTCGGGSKSVLDTFQKVERVEELINSGEECESSIQGEAVRLNVTNKESNETQFLYPILTSYWNREV